MSLHKLGIEMSYQRLLVLATLCAIGAFLTLVLRIAHPHHRQLAMVIYGIGWVPFVLSIRKLSITFPDQTTQVLRWKIHILVDVLGSCLQRCHHGKERGPHDYDIQKITHGWR